MSSNEVTNEALDSLRLDLSTLESLPDIEAKKIFIVLKNDEIDEDFIKLLVSTAS